MQEKYRQISTGNKNKFQYNSYLNNYNAQQPIQNMVNCSNRVNYTNNYTNNYNNQQYQQ